MSEQLIVFLGMPPVVLSSGPFGSTFKVLGRKSARQVCFPSFRHSPNFEKQGGPRDGGDPVARGAGYRRPR